MEQTKRTHSKRRKNKGHLKIFLLGVLICAILGAVWAGFSRQKLGSVVALESAEVEINGTTVKIPCSFQELQATGVQAKAEQGTPETLVSAGVGDFVQFEDEQGDWVLACVENEAEEEKRMDECAITRIAAYDTSLKEGELQVVFPEGIEIGATVKQLKAAYGEPFNSYEVDDSMEYIWWSEGKDYYLSAQVSLETGKAVYIFYCRYSNEI